MADTGDHWPAPDQWKRIKPADLRAECMKCGGDGRAWETATIPGNLIVPQHTMRRMSGPCKPCGGTGKVFPRKIDI